MANPEERLSALPGKWCPYVSGDHAPVCNSNLGLDCHNCENYKDGITDIPLDEKLMTKNMKMLLYLRNKRDSCLAETEPHYQKAHTYDDPIEEYQIKVRKEQGR